MYIYECIFIKKIAVDGNRNHTCTANTYLTTCKLPTRMVYQQYKEESSHLSEYIDNVLNQSSIMYERRLVAEQQHCKTLQHNFTIAMHSNG